VSEDLRRLRPNLQRRLIVECAGCRRLSDFHWPGWRAYRIDDREGVEPPELAFFCPNCRPEQLGCH
jgi:hypothetical protein